MHNSMLACMSMFHFEEALKCADFLLDNYNQEPEIFFRKAQLLYLNKASSFRGLQEALEILEFKCIDEKRAKERPLYAK